MADAPPDSQRYSSLPTAIRAPMRRSRTRMVQQAGASEHTSAGADVRPAGPGPEPDTAIVACSARGGSSATLRCFGCCTLLT